MTSKQLARVLGRKLLGKSHTRAMMAYYREKLPKLDFPQSPSEWDKRIARIRKDLLAKVYLRGHRPGILNAPPEVQWRGVIETGKGYRIRKLRYEGYPGVLTTMDEAMSIIKDLDCSNIGIQPDVYHMNIEEASVSDAIRAAGEHVKHFHINETNRYSLGSGHADYKAIMKALKEIDFAGYVAVYMPLTTQEISNMAGSGYKASGSPEGGTGAARPDLKHSLEMPLRYLKGIESLVDLGREAYRTR